MGKITKMSINGLELTKRSEGFRSNAYVDPGSGNLPITIGYGSTYYLNGKKVTLKDRPISEKDALILLLDLLKTYERSVDSFTRDDITQNQFDALVDFAYNCGVANLKSSTLLKKVNLNPNDPTIADEFKKWVYGGDGTHNHKDDDLDGLIDEPGEKQRLAGLVTRRNSQAELYFKK